MADEIKDRENMFEEEPGDLANKTTEEEEVWGAVPLKEKLEGAPDSAFSQEEVSAQVSQEEVDALVKGLDGFDLLTDEIPDIPDLEDQGSADGISPGDQPSPAANGIDDIIASVQGTEFDLSPGPSVSPSGSPETRPASFPSLDPGIGGFSGGAERSSLDLLLDIPVQLSVVLGRTRKTIGEVLALEPGAIVELDKLAGEPVEVLANGKLVLRGEVVVIDESFGIRVTELVSKN